MVRIRTRPDGTKYPIEGKKGRGGIAVAAGVTALLVAAYSGGGAIPSGGSGSVASDGSISVRTSKGKQAARDGQYDKLWKRMRLRVRRQRPSRQHFNCAVHSFGQVRGFFARNPCRSLKRTVVTVADERGNTAVVSLAWVQMRTKRAASKLDRLDHRDGTGDVKALGQSLLASQGVSFTGAHYESDTKRARFTRAEVAPLSGMPDPELLDGVAQAAVLLPPR